MAKTSDIRSDVKTSEGSNTDTNTVMLGYFAKTSQKI